MFVKRIIEDRLSINIRSMSAVSGGDINQAYRIEHSRGVYFVKINELNRFPGMFEKEAEGLKKLKQNGSTTPEVIDCFEFENFQILILDFIETERSSSEFWDAFALDLAELHKSSDDQFGLDYDNYIGSLHQDNRPAANWEEFFIDRRLRPLIRKGFDQGNLNRNHLNDFESFFRVFSELIPFEKPALLHGDLWSGNLLCGLGQKPVFIDPAIYFGHREIDLSMTQLFGGFNSAYLDKYDDLFPLQPGFENRIQIHNLYPNLVHLILFGTSYLSGIERVIKKYASRD